MIENVVLRRPDVPREERPESIVPASFISAARGLAPFPAALPASARNKFRALGDRLADLQAVSHSRTERRMEAQTEEMRARLDLDGAQRTMRRDMAAAPDSGPLTAAQQRHRNAVAELEAATAQAATPAEETKSMRGLVNRLESYFLELRRLSDIPLHSRTEPALRKGETPAAAVERVRAGLAVLRADLHKVRSAPRPAAQAKELARAHVAELAERGRPDVFPLVERAGAIGYAQRRVETFARSGEGIGLSGMGDIPDPVALAAWLFRDQFIARLEAEIDAMADDEAALGDDERATREREIVGQILAFERDEEALIEISEAQGTSIRRRADADPRAVLGLSGDLPAPKIG